jgi:hypothetical protein
VIWVWTALSQQSGSEPWNSWDAFEGKGKSNEGYRYIRKIVSTSQLQESDTEPHREGVHKITVLISLQPLKRHWQASATFSDIPVILVKSPYSELLQGSRSSAKVKNAWRYSYTSQFVSMTLGFIMYTEVVKVNRGWDHVLITDTAVVRGHGASQTLLSFNIFFLTKSDSITLVRSLSCLYCKTGYTTCFG